MESKLMFVSAKKVASFFGLQIYLGLLKGTWLIDDEEPSLSPRGTLKCEMDFSFWFGSGGNYRWFYLPYKLQLLVNLQLSIYSKYFSNIIQLRYLVGFISNAWMTMKAFFFKVGVVDIINRANVRDYKVQRFLNQTYISLDGSSSSVVPMVFHKSQSLCHSHHTPFLLDSNKYLPNVPILEEINFFKLRSILFLTFFWIPFPKYLFSDLSCIET